MLITDRKLCRAPLPDIVKQALEGGVDMVQLREKDLPPTELLRLACSLREIIDDKARFVVNGNAQVALDCGADGVHLPENGLDIEEARAILGEKALIGKSVHSPAAAAEASNADYLILGTIYATSSKVGVRPGGAGLIKEAAETSHAPIIAVGGITQQRIPEILAAGAVGIAVCSAIMCADDPWAVCRNFRSALDTGYREVDRHDKSDRQRRTASA